MSSRRGQSEKTDEFFLGKIAANLETLTRDFGTFRTEQINAQQALGAKLDSHSADDEKRFDNLEKWRYWQMGVGAAIFTIGCIAGWALNFVFK